MKTRRTPGGTIRKRHALWAVLALGLGLVAASLTAPLALGVTGDPGGGDPILSQQCSQASGGSIYNANVAEYPGYQATTLCYTYTTAFRAAVTSSNGDELKYCGSLTCYYAARHDSYGNIVWPSGSTFGYRFPADGAWHFSSPEGANLRRYSTVIHFHHEGLTHVYMIQEVET
jgi:hypothetical protein